MKFQNLKTYQKIFLFSVLTAALISVFDIWSLNSGIFGTIDNYIHGNYPAGWWSLFFKFGIVLISLPSLFYFYFVKKDKSEAISFFIGSIILWFTGISDILFFWFRGQAVPSALPWLDNSVIIGWISQHIFNSPVTNGTLFASAIFGLIAVFFVDKVLKERF